MPTQLLVSLPAEQQELPIGGAQSGETPAIESPALRARRIGLQPTQQEKRLERHEEQVAERDHQFLRPGTGDLVGPKREEIGADRTGMGESSGHTSRPMYRVGIGEEEMRTGGISSSR